MVSTTSAENAKAQEARRKDIERKVASFQKRAALKKIVRAMTRREEVLAIEAFIASGRVVHLPIQLDPVEAPVPVRKQAIRRSPTRGRSAARH